MIPAVTDKYNRIDTLEKTGCSRITALGTRANHYWHVPSLEAAFTWRPADQIWVQAPMWHFRVDIDINETLGPASYVNEDIDPWIEPSFIITRPWIYEETFVHHLFSSFFFASMLTMYPSISDTSCIQRRFSTRGAVSAGKRTSWMRAISCSLKASESSIWLGLV